MNPVYVGELAALGTATCWSVSSIFFTLASRRMGSLMANRARLLAAVLLVGMAHFILLGRLLPAGAGPERWAWFAASAIVGLVIGDTLLFQSYLIVGTRIGLLLMSLNPVFAAVLGWLIFGEVLQPFEVIGMALALFGAGWVVLERTGANGEPHRRGRIFVLGVLMALGAGVCQASGLLLAKPALDGDFPALSAVIMRMSVAMSAMWVLAAATGQAGPTVRALRDDRRADVAVLGGAFMGPFLGVWLSLIAVQNVRVGIASTLMAMSPVLLLPLVHWVYKEHISLRALAGTAVAMAGIAVIFLV